MQKPPTAEEAARAKRRGWLRAGLIAVGVLLVALAALSIDFEPNLGHLDVGVVSGAAEGHYHAQVEAFRRRAERDGGRVRNLETAGSGENLRRLADPGEACEVDFGLVQDGSHFDEDDAIEVVARLPRGETLFFFGRDAEAIEDFRDLRGRTIGAGPEGSGTAQLVEDVFALPGFDSLGVTIVHAPVAEQLDAAARGDLDLAAAVVYEDARLPTEAVRRRGLSIASFASARAAATQLVGVGAHTIEAGHYDAVRGLPRTDRQVLSVDTLILASRCARRSEINAILSVLSRELPGFVERNRNGIEPHGLAMSAVATEYFDNHGPQLVDQYLPRVVDVIPLSNFMTFVMGISVLFNVMSVLNRFRLWRLDTRRVKLERELRELFGGGITRGEIDLMDPHVTLTTHEERERFDGIVLSLRGLVEVCRKQAVSFLVPMGQEMVYRYQEDLMIDTLATMRRFRNQLPPLEAPTEPPADAGPEAEA
ncbi:MAG: ABC transporter substrate-binding protein [Myxococcales bacterium]|nr:ABC transporter substrate-binding protein [Myxococcales bacterium]